MDLLSLAYGSLAVLTLVATLASRRLEYAPRRVVWCAVFLFATWVITMATNALGGFEGEVLIFPVLHLSGMLFFFSSWLSHPDKAGRWKVAVMLLFLASSSADLDFDVDYWRGGYDPVAAHGYILAQNLLFAARLLIVWVIHGGAWARSCLAALQDFGGVAFGRVPAVRSRRSRPSRW